jgi:bifunctional non-homologous end joining protein LigD
MPYMRLPRMDTAQLSLLRTPFNDPDFIFELKVDGFRALAYIDDGVCELVSRRRNPYKSFRELATSLRQLKVKNAIIDGELACLATNGAKLPPVPKKPPLRAVSVPTKTTGKSRRRSEAN